MADARVVRGSEGEVYDPTWVFKHGSRTGAPFDFLIGKVAYLTGPPLHVHREQLDTFYVQTFRSGLAVAPALLARLNEWYCPYFRLTTFPVQ